MVRYLLLLLLLSDSHFSSREEEVTGVGKSGKTSDCIIPTKSFSEKINLRLSSRLFSVCWRCWFELVAGTGSTTGLRL